MLTGRGPFEVRPIFSPIKRESPFRKRFFIKSLQRGRVFPGELAFRSLLPSIFETPGVEHGRSFIFPKLRVVFSGLESR